MSASRPHDGERFDDDDAFDPWPIAGDGLSFPFNEDEDEPDEMPPADRCDVDERIDQARRHMIHGNPENAEFRNSEQGGAFPDRMDAIDHGPSISAFRQLLRDGVPLPSPESVPEEEITCVLWAVIGGLAARRVFLCHTDHLSDRELYEKLWFDRMREDVLELRSARNSAWYFDMIADEGPSSRVFLMYYADDRFRAQVAAEDSSFELPPREPLPFDRDQYLPESGDGRPANQADAPDAPES